MKIKSSILVNISKFEDIIKYKFKNKKFILIVIKFSFPNL